MAKSFQEAGLFGGHEMDTVRENMRDEIDRPSIK